MTASRPLAGPRTRVARPSNPSRRRAAPKKKKMVVESDEEEDEVDLSGDEAAGKENVRAAAPRATRARRGVRA